MESSLHSITWEAPEHHHVEKGNDWFFALGIIIVSMVFVAILLSNFLFALLITLAGGTLAISASKRPRVIPYAITTRGVRIDEEIHPYSTLKSYYIDEEDYRGPQLLIESDHKIMSLMVMPIPADHVDDIETILKEKLDEEYLEEPFLVKLLEVLGF